MKDYTDFTIEEKEQWQDFKREIFDTFNNFFKGDEKEDKHKPYVYVQIIYNGKMPYPKFEVAFNVEGFVNPSNDVKYKISDKVYFIFNVFAKLFPHMVYYKNLWKYNCLFSYSNVINLDYPVWQKILPHITEDEYIAQKFGL